jgi:hypothetical protein
MRRAVRLTLAIGLSLSGWTGLALADPGKDESGKGRERGGYARHEGGSPGRNQSYGRELRFDPGEPRGRAYGSRDDQPRRGRRYANEGVNIPAGHLPPPGECRTWYPGRPAGHQPPPHRC